MLSRVMKPSALQGRGRRPERRTLQRSGRFGAPVWAARAPMQRVYEQIARVAGTAVTVFITGESGTGKEVVAQHRARPEPAPRAAVPGGELRRDLAAT